MGKISGTLRKVVIDGITFSVTADVDVTINSGVLKEGMPTSGPTMFKHTRQSPDIESITVSAEPVENDLLLNFNNRLTTYPLSLEFADGSVYRAVGQIGHEGYTNADNIATIRMIPDNASVEWELFAA